MNNSDRFFDWVLSHCCCERSGFFGVVGKWLGTLVGFLVTLIYVLVLLTKVILYGPSSLQTVGKE